MAKNFVNEGEGVFYKNTRSGIIYSGSVVSMGALVGVALGDMPVGESGTVRIVGVWKLPKDTSTAMSIGDIAYWDTASKKIVSADTDGAADGVVHAGVVCVDATAASTTVAVKINA